MRLWTVLALVVFVVFAGLNAFGQEKKAGCQDKSDGKEAACQAKADGKAVATADEKAGHCAAKADEKAGHCSAKADGKACSGDKADGKCATKAGCSAQRQKDCSSGNVPLITYRVGDRDMCCDKEAAELAKSTGKKIQYVLSGKAYDSEADAMPVYAELLEKHFDGLLNVKYTVGDEILTCPQTAAKLAKDKKSEMHYKLASFEFKDEAAAKKAAEHARAAADKVAMKMVVGDESYQCPMSAKEAAEKAGKKLEYAVGETRTPCEKTARVTLAKARIHAALETLAADAGA